ncbi:MAG: peptidoglycan-binding protein [Myxococcales bacterium]|nr:peptidoglycan-binding protein [Myxococcales bacterium]
MRVDARPPQSASAPLPKTFTSPSGKVYTEPGRDAALARGHFGDRVKELQQRLNAAGLKPPLATDGLFGPATEAALQKLTGSSSLTAAAEAALSKPSTTPAAGETDGFDAGGKKPSLSELPAVMAPDQKTPAAGSVAEKTLAIARGELGTVDPRKTGPDGKYQGWDKLQSIFEKTTGWRPSDKEIQASSQPQKKAWCGVFATHVLQEAGVDVKWDLTKGKMTGDVQHVLQPTYRDWRTYKTERQAFEATIKPGDVITLNGSLNHHAIVTSVNPDGTVNTIDGNKPHIGEGHFKLADVTSYYRPTGGVPSGQQAAPSPVPAPAGTISTEGGEAAGASAGKSISSQFYKAGVSGPALAKSDAFMKETVDLTGDKQSRIKSLSTFTQFDNKYSEGSDDNACGATAIVAGAALEGGKEGLQKLIEVIEERGNTTQIKRAGPGWKAATIPEFDKLADIKSRVATGKVTQQDLADLKTIVYGQLRQVEKDIGANSTNPTIDIRAIQQYLQTDVGLVTDKRPLAGMFSNMNIKLVDTMGTGYGNHFVLMFNDGTGHGENAVFDPWPTKSGNQINRNQAELLWYHHGVKNAVR